MKKLIFAIFAIMLITLSCDKGNSSTYKNNIMNNDTINISDITVKNIDGQEVNLSDYKGKVLLIVNVASHCGFTPQYTALEQIYKKYNANGFEILAFPSNDFGGQEPGTNEEIKNFCTSKYDVTFPMFDKIKVLGDEKSPLYARIIKYPPEGDVSWNFEKFIVDKNGNVVGRFKSKVTPDSEEITSAIEKELSK
jgi:glutathione peroxidase